MIHSFIFVPGTWIGKGKITFLMSKEEILFYTKWEISEEEKGTILCQQSIEMPAIDQRSQNLLRLSSIDEKGFLITLQNESFSDVVGKGILTDKTLAWEYHYPELEGFEIYEKKDSQSYAFHAEYVSSDQFRTLINGAIWQKEQE